MDAKDFSQGCDLINKNLVNLEVNRAFNSIGSNIFFEFGKEKEVFFKNGKKSIQKEWSIWIGNSSWRMSEKGKYVVGSGDSPQTIQTNIQKLLGKRFKSFCFFSQFLDVEFDFENECRLTTFFNWREEDQWTVFLPDRTNIGADCASLEEIKNIQSIASGISIIKNYKKLDFKESVLSEIFYDQHLQPNFRFENDFFINLENCTWRLEKDEDYLVGYLDRDQEEVKYKMSGLIGKKLKQIDVLNPMMDARFQFENQYVLKTFSCCQRVNQWNITSQGVPIFRACIEIGV